MTSALAIATGIYAFGALLHAGLAINDWADIRYNDPRPAWVGALLLVLFVLTWPAYTAICTVEGYRRR